MIFSKPVFQLWPEVPDKTLYWPSSAVSQSADGVALNLFAQFPNHINLLWLRVALSEPPHHCISSQYPLCRGCTDHMTRACRTLQALQLP